MSGDTDSKRFKKKRIGQIDETAVCSHDARQFFKGQIGDHLDVNSTQAVDILGNYDDGVVQCDRGWIGRCGRHVTGQGCSKHGDSPHLELLQVHRIQHSIMSLLKWKAMLLHKLGSQGGQWGGNVIAGSGGQTCFLQQAGGRVDAANGNKLSFIRIDHTIFIPVKFRWDRQCEGAVAPGRRHWLFRFAVAPDPVTVEIDEIANTIQVTIEERCAPLAIAVQDEVARVIGDRGTAGRGGRINHAGASGDLQRAGRSCRSGTFCLIAVPDGDIFVVIR